LAEIARLPLILNVPPKLRTIFEKFDEHRYFLGEGGRGAGKSHAIARFLLYLGDRYNLRIVCGREIQNSIAESVYSLLADLIAQYQLPYKIFATKIEHLTKGTTIHFRGFREQGKFNIQGMEGIDCLWIDEAQAITKETLDVLIPTIRKDDARIFFSMNRHVHDDPVFKFCEGRKDCLHININYFENPFCTQALKNEAEECKKRSMSDYNHIWLGLPLASSEDAVFTHDELMDCKKVDFRLRDGYGLRIGGFDVARYGDDKCAVVTLQQMGALNWEAIHTDQWDHRDLSYTTGRILQESNEQRMDRSIIDEDGIGSAPLDMLNKGRGLDNFTGFRNLPLNIKDDSYYANVRTRDTYKLKELIRKGHIRITDDALLSELEHAFRYTFDNYQRRILISKEVMKNKHKVKSPNLADSCVMAVSLIGTINYKQQQQYNRQPQYCKEDNILAGAGIR